MVQRRAPFPLEGGRAGVGGGAGRARRGLAAKVSSLAGSLPAVLFPTPIPNPSPLQGEGLRIAAIVGCLSLTACGAPQPALTPEQVMALTPGDARLAGLYETSCKACHAMPGNLAPQVHDRAAWDPRWKQGEAVLLDHTIQGFNAMPAGGQCASCTPDDFKALIRFMAGREDSAK